MKALITLSSDFQPQSNGVGLMEAIALQINPNAQVIHLMHGIPSFNITAGARTMETIACLKPAIHVCVVDPGVGTQRKSIIIQTKRGDFLIGPDNGVLIPASKILGGISIIVEISNPEYMNQPVSNIFHGRDIFTPAAAYLSLGIHIGKFGKNLQEEDLRPPPYKDALIKDNQINCEIISINKFGSAHLNILHSEWDKFNAGGNIVMHTHNLRLCLPIKDTFGDVQLGKPMILKDDYNRLELAINQGSFTKDYNLNIGDKLSIRKP